MPLLSLLARIAFVAIASVSSLASAASPAAANRTFDTWSENFAADYMRLAPSFATATQYFNGPEQDELDRKLAPLTKEARARSA